MKFRALGAESAIDILLRLAEIPLAICDEAGDVLACNELFGNWAGQAGPGPLDRVDPSHPMTCVGRDGAVRHAYVSAYPTTMFDRPVYVVKLDVVMPGEFEHDFTTTIGEALRDPLRQIVGNDGEVNPTKALLDEVRLVTVLPDQTPWPAIEVEPATEFPGDLRTVRLLLVNLIEHAARRGEGQAVSLRIGRKGEDVFVEDDASPAELEDLFDPHRVGPGTLALSNVQRIVARVKGQVWAERAGESGLRIWFRIT